jgi:predicted site-specific integrase-resolvase
MAAPLSAATAPASVPSSKFSLDLKQAADYTGLSVWWLRQSVYNGVLKPINMNQKPYIFLRTELERYVRDGAARLEAV